MLQELVVFLQGGSAACRIRDHRVITAVENRVDVLPRQCTRWFSKAGMNMKRTAAVLCLRDRDLTAVSAQDANGGFVQPGEEDVRHTSAQEGDPITPLADRGQNLSVPAVELRHF